MAKRLAFIAWSRLSRRTRDLAKVLGAELVFLEDRPPYLRAWRETPRVLKEIDPDIVLVQLPQGPLLWRVLGVSKRLGFRVVADVHTGFIHTTTLGERLLNKPFQRFLRRVDLVLAHNESEAELIRERTGLDPDKVLVVYDPLPQRSPRTEKPPINDIEPGNYILVPASWAHDEPLDSLVKAFTETRLSRENFLVITGNPQRNPRLYKRVRKQATNSIVLTGYLPRAQYEWLLENTKLVVALTTREYTMLSAIWEAIAFRKTFIASRTRTLTRILGSSYPCLAENKVESLKKTIENCIGSSWRDIDMVINKLQTLSLDSIKKLQKRLDNL